MFSLYFSSWHSSDDCQPKFPLKSQQDRNAFLVKLTRLRGIVIRTSDRFQLSLADFDDAADANGYIDRYLVEAETNFNIHRGTADDHISLNARDLSLAKAGHDSPRPLIVGEGGYGTIWLGKNEHLKFIAIKGQTLKDSRTEVVAREITNQVIANKILPGNAARYFGILVMRNNIAEETAMHRPFIVTTFEGITPQSMINLSLEEAMKLEGRASSPLINTREWLNIILEMFHLCHKINTAGYIHGDFHGDNMLLQIKPDGHLTIKVIDFALLKPMKAAVSVKEDMWLAVSTAFKFIDKLRNKRHANDKQFDSAYEYFEPMLDSTSKDRLLQERGGYVPVQRYDDSDCDKAYIGQSDSPEGAKFDSEERREFFAMSGIYTYVKATGERVGWQLKRDPHKQQICHKGVSYLNFTEDEKKLYNVPSGEGACQVMRKFFQL